VQGADGLQTYTYGYDTGRTVKEKMTADTAVQAELKERLLDERKRLIEDVAGLRDAETGGMPGAHAGGGNWEHAAAPSHMADDASELAEQETAIGLVANVQSRLAEVDQALQKMERGTYGTCDDCGEPIAPARLQALPHATLCINCKTKLEKQQ